MKAEPVFGKPALTLGSNLIIADLHIGVEYELESKGIRVPLQWEEMAEETIRIGGKTGSYNLIINGDLKHGIPSDRREFRDVRLFLRKVSSHFHEIHIVKGNHDGGIERHLPPNIIVHEGSGFLAGKYGILHGHAWPSEELEGAKTLIMAHTHPAVLFTDKLGNTHKEPCWIRGRYGNKELVIMPAMSRFYGGSPVNEGALLGPILSSSDFSMEDAEIYLLDGTYAGKLSEIKKEG